MRAADPDLLALHRTMALMRRFEEACADLWERGLISGELHLGIGEEAIAAGVVDHLDDRDAIAADHRPTPALIARGGDLTEIALELLGQPSGLCAGHGGHMHLLDPALAFASSGIVGASAPQACGFALAAQRRGEGGVAVSFFGEGAANQGMLMEAWNLAAAWKLPVLFVAKDNRMAITTRSASVTAGRLSRRARAFGIPAERIDGSDVRAVWRAAGRGVERARRGQGPSFLHVRCRRREGHFQGDPLLRIVDHPLRQTRDLAPGLAGAAASRSGARFQDRAMALADIGRSFVGAALPRLGVERDPLVRSRRRLGTDVAEDIELGALAEVDDAIDATLHRIWTDEHA